MKTNLILKVFALSALVGFVHQAKGQAEIAASLSIPDQQKQIASDADPACTSDDPIAQQQAQLMKTSIIYGGQTPEAAFAAVNNNDVNQAAITNCLGGIQTALQAAQQRKDNSKLISNIQDGLVQALTWVTGKYHENNNPSIQNNSYATIGFRG